MLLRLKGHLIHELRNHSPGDVVEVKCEEKAKRLIHEKAAVRYEGDELPGAEASPLEVRNAAIVPKTRKATRLKGPNNDVRNPDSEDATGATDGLGAGDPEGSLPG